MTVDCAERIIVAVVRSSFLLFCLQVLLGIRLARPFVENEEKNGIRKVLGAGQASSNARSIDLRIPMRPAPVLDEEKSNSGAAPSHGRAAS